MVGSSDLSGEILAPNLPGLRVVLDPASEQPDSLGVLDLRWFLTVMSALVLSITLTGAYLLWRDMSREARLGELRSQFISSVTHELKTPLTSIRIFAETLRMNRVAEPEAKAEYLDTIISESERLTRLLNNVLDFSKVEQGRKHYHLELKYPADAVQAAVRSMDRLLQEEGFHLRLDIQPGIPPMRIDADAIQQAVVNLLSNAMKYSGASREIVGCLLREGSNVVIRVIDRGIGVAEADQARIFEKYYRVQDTADRRIPGTGLGLTLVKHIAEAHGGHVAVESAPGQGSRSSLYLPLEPPS